MLSASVILQSVKAVARWRFKIVNTRCKVNILEPAYSPSENIRLKSPGVTSFKKILCVFIRKGFYHVLSVTNHVTIVKFNLVYGWSHDHLLLCCCCSNHTRSVPVRQRVKRSFDSARRTSLPPLVSSSDSRLSVSGVILIASPPMISVTPLQERRDSRRQRNARTDAGCVRGNADVRGLMFYPSYPQGKTFCRTSINK